MARHSLTTFEVISRVLSDCDESDFSDIFEGMFYCSNIIIIIYNYIIIVIIMIIIIIIL